MINQVIEKSQRQKSAEPLNLSSNPKNPPIRPKSALPFKNLTPQQQLQHYDNHSLSSLDKLPKTPIPPATATTRNQNANFTNWSTFY